MHIIQEKLLLLAKNENLAKLSFREIARKINLPQEPAQKIKHHLIQLQKKGFISIDRERGVMEKAKNIPSWARGLLVRENSLFSIPIIGTANCGPATIFAEQNFQGFLRVSSKLVGRNRPEGLYAVRADGSSMNRADVAGKTIEDGDYIIVDGHVKNAKTNDIVLAVIDERATVKRFINDQENGQFVLMADSSRDYSPIYLHPDDIFNIAGKIVGVVKRPKKKE